MSTPTTNETTTIRPRIVRGHSRQAKIPAPIIVPMPIVVAETSP